ncbi:MAG: hypothetical protein ACRCTJ_03880, partial [Brevinema sp.]
HTQNNYFNLIFSLDFLIYLSKKKQLISYSYTGSTINDLHKELFRFQPQLFYQDIWYTMNDKELSNLFNQMLSHRLVSLQMLALFFLYIQCTDPSRFFSKRIAEELVQEIKTITDLPESLTKLIYYIIERNIILFFYQKEQIPSFQNYYIEYHSKLFYDFLIPSAKKMSLNSLSFIQKNYQKPQFYTFINQLPYHELLSFLKVSPPENREIIKSAFSKEGQIKLEQDLEKTKIKSFYNLFEKFGLLEAQSKNESVETLIKKNIQSGRDWEFLAREIPLLDLLRLVDNIDPSLTKTLSPLLVSLILHHRQKYIKFPQCDEIALNELYQLILSKINYLKLLSIL